MTDDLANLKATYATMTPGPWYKWLPNAQGCYCVHETAGSRRRLLVVQELGGAQDARNAEGIVAIVNAFPALIERLEQAEAWRLAREDETCHTCRQMKRLVFEHGDTSTMCELHDIYCEDTGFGCQAWEAKK